MVELVSYPESGQVPVVIEPISEEEMDTLRTTSESLKEQVSPARIKKKG